VQSILEQSFQDMEIVFVDDGSSDNTVEIITAAIAGNPRQRLQLLSQPNKGVASARNLGVSAARGEYILPLDSDDLIEPAMLAECADLLDQSSTLSVVYTDRRDFGDIEQLCAAGKYELSSQKYLNQLAYCCMYRKSVWAEIGGYRENVSGFDDWDFWIALASRKKRGMHVAKPLLKHRRHRASQLWSVSKNYETLFAKIIVNNREVYSDKEVSVAERLLSHGEPASVISASKMVFMRAYYAAYEDTQANNLAAR
jgi:glycosyltransferase involved in cell wall biosynthesis